jgi:sugar lactone lactonase YvrE
MPSNIANCARTTFALALSLCLNACGGSGGSSTPPPPVATSPAISAQPQNVTASVGTSASFSVTAVGDAPLSYQWQRNGADLAGATGAQYVLPAAQFIDSGSKWSVVVRNNAGSATSVQATLTVTGTALLAGSLQAKSFTSGQLIGIAQDGSGNTYLLDRALETALYKVTAQGVTTLLPLSARDSDAGLYQPTGMTRDAAGNFYVTDPKCAIRKISPAGEITILAGNTNRCGHDDGKGSAATLGGGISAVAVDAANNVFVAEHQATIRKITPDGVVTTVAGVAGAFGSVDGTGNAARFGDMQSIAIDGAGNLYVTDAGVTGTAPGIRKITPGGVVTTLAGGVTYGGADGQHGSASFSTLSGLTIDAAGNLYAGDQGNHSIRKITPDGVVTTFAGQSTTQNPPDTNPTDGPAATATFRQPVAMTMDGAGNIFVAEANPALNFNALRKISANGIVSTITGTLAGRGAADGAGPAARFSLPRGLAVDVSGNVWVADTGNQLIRQISASGVVTTLAGATGYATLTDPGDGKGALARFFQPLAIAVDTHGTAFVTDAVHNTVRKVLSDGTVTTLAGKVGSYGAVDGVGSAATFAGLLGITSDRMGILYVSDMSAVRRIDPISGAVTTLAGQLGPFSQGSTDGTGAVARFGYLPAIAVDSAGNLYVVDSVNSNVRKITPSGVVTTLAGNAGVTGSADGQGAAASFNHPQGIAVDGTGNVYVADTENNLIRRISPVGVVTTIAGQVGANGNVPGSLNNPLSQPTGLAFDANGILYVCASNGIFQLHL